MTSLNQNNLSNSLNDSDEISLKELIQKIKEWVAYLKTKWKLIIAISAIGGILGIVYSIISKPKYKALMTFVLDESQSNGGGMSSAMGLASSFGIDIGSSGGAGMFSNANILELMKSRYVVEKTLLNSVYINGRQLSLANYYIEFKGLRNKWSKDLTIKNLQFPPNSNRTQFSLQQDSILEKISSEIIKNDLTIAQKDKKVSIISVEVKTENELFSKLFCEQLAKETSDFYIETKSKKSRLNVEILQKQTDSIRGELNGAIAGVASAMDNVFNLNSALSSKTAPSKRRQVDVQANTAILTQLVAQLELAKVNLRKETPLIQVIDQPILPLTIEKFNTFVVALVSFLSFLFLTSFILIINNLDKE
jgi:uncharacterized protein involved in exopolysaccharide biosynthesis